MFLCEPDSSIIVTDGTTQTYVFPTLSDGDGVDNPNARVVVDPATLPSFASYNIATSTLTFAATPSGTYVGQTFNINFYATDFYDVGTTYTLSGDV